MIGVLQSYLFFILCLAVLLLCLWALVDALMRPAGAFTYADKRTKGFWAAVLGLATLLAFIALPLPPAGGMGLILFTLLSAVGAGIYLADVRPAVRHYRPRGGSGGQRW